MASYMYTLGLTGGIGAGKSHAAAAFRSFGIENLDTDVVSRQVCAPGSPCLAELAQYYGADIIKNDGTLDRRLLADRAFVGANAHPLNEVTHKYILRECKDWLSKRASCGDFAAIVEAPLLYESGFNNHCDFVIAVIARDSVRLRRIMERGGISSEDAGRRMKLQHGNKYFAERADYLIYNNGDEDIALQVDLICQQLKWV